jgi:hypothetical protein
MLPVILMFMMTTHQETILGITFFIVAVLSTIRIYFSFSTKGDRKVINTFNILIFTTSFSRCIIFLSPDRLIQSNFAETTVIAFLSKLWLSTFVAEVLSCIGSLSLFGVFILVACYWVIFLYFNNFRTDFGLTY